MDGKPCLEPLPWETRNLGVPSFGVTSSFFDHPDESLLEGALAGVGREHPRFFVQARCTTDSRVSRMLESNGFYFVETSVCPTVTLSRCDALDRFAADPSAVLPRRFDRADLAVAPVDAATSEAIASIADESFVDDRFHADHKCPEGVAGRRYRLWLGDLLRDPSVTVDTLLLRGQPVSFMASRLGDLLLAGFAKRYVNAGLGEFFWLSVLDRLRARGVSRVTSRISIGNVAALNLYVRLDFKFRDPQSTFHLWSG